MTFLPASTLPERRLRDLGVRATAVHPGEITTGLGRHLTDTTRALMVERVGRRAMVFFG